MTTVQCVITTGHVRRAEESACALKAGLEISVKVPSSMTIIYQIYGFED